MSKMLSLAGGIWCARQLEKQASSGERAFVIDALTQPGGVYEQTFEEIAALLTDAEPLEHVKSTRAQGALLVRSVLRAGIVIYELAHEPLQRLPWALFLPGFDEEYAAWLVALPPCCRDRFTQSIVDHFPTVEALLSPPCQSLLKLLKTQLDLNNYSTERCHSQSQRRNKAQSQTHAMHVSQAAYWRQGKATVNWCSSILEAAEPVMRPPRRSRHACPPADGDAEPGGQVAGQAPKRRRRGRSGSGGPFRAFINHMSLQGRLKGQKRFPKMAEA